MREREEEEEDGGAQRDPGRFRGGGLRWDGELEEGVDEEPKGWKYPKGEKRGGMKGEASGMMGG